jgi:hypothetical protein
MAVNQFEERILIRELYGRYAIAAAEQDGATWLACWAANATWKTPHFEVSGRQALRESWTATWVNFSNVAAFNEIGAISLDGDVAKATSSTLEIIKLSAGGLLKMAGLYRDELVREGGQWCFARREYQALNQEMSGAV